MAKKIIVTKEQYKRLSESLRKRIIVNESQLDIIREYENNKVLRYEFEVKLRKYMEELKDNPCKPEYDDFFSSHDIPEDVLQNKMLDLGIIKRTDKINEPMDANGKKHGVHTRKYIFSSKGFDDNVDKLYGYFFKNGERILKETDCGGAMGGAIGDTSAGGATNAEGVGGQYTVPFGGVQRRKIGVSGSTVSDVDMSPALDRTRGKIAVNRVNEGIDEVKGLSTVADEEYYDIIDEFKEVYENNEYVDTGFEIVNDVKIPFKIFEVDGNKSNPENKKIPSGGAMLESCICVFFKIYELTDDTIGLYDKFLKTNQITNKRGMIILTCYSLNGILDDESVRIAFKILPHEQIHGLQITKGRENDNKTNKNYILARKIRNSNSDNIDKILADVFWYFNKKEIDANIHKFIVDYRECLEDDNSLESCDMPKIIMRMSLLLDNLKKMSPDVLGKYLSKYKIKRGMFLKKCKQMFRYAVTEYDKVIKNSELGSYPKPQNYRKI